MWGEETPTPEEGKSWQYWRGTGDTAPTVIGDGDWGKLRVISSAIVWADVVDLGDASERFFTVEQNSYGAGDTPTVEIRGSVTTFTRFAGAPAWEAYPLVSSQSWRYVQIRFKGSAV